MIYRYQVPVPGTRYFVPGTGTVPVPGTGTWYGAQ
jgi:hypothetical protein